MKKGIHTLIKLRKRSLDELRRTMASLENQKTQLLQASANIAEELKKEIELAKLQTEMRGFFGDFAKRIKLRQEDIAREVTVLDKKMAKLAEEISVAFSELKKFEIARDNAEKREIAEQNRKDTIMLDEIAGQLYRRKQPENN